MTGLALLKDNLLASVSFDCSLRIWDLSSMKQVSVVANAHDSLIQCVEYCEVRGTGAPAACQRCGMPRCLPAPALVHEVKRTLGLSLARSLRLSFVVRCPMSRPAHARTLQARDEIATCGMGSKVNVWDVSKPTSVRLALVLDHGGCLKGPRRAGQNVPA